jgi:hypothetical protein
LVSHNRPIDQNHAQEEGKTSDDTKDDEDKVSSDKNSQNPAQNDCSDDRTISDDTLQELRESEPLEQPPGYRKPLTTNKQKVYGNKVEPSRGAAECPHTMK